MYCKQSFPDWTLVGDFRPNYDIPRIPGNGRNVLELPFLAWTLVDYFRPESGIPRKSLHVLNTVNSRLTFGDNQASSVNSE
jgi:hypothetical protein